MSDKFDQIEKAMLDAHATLSPKVDAFLLIVSKYPNGDDNIGRVQFIRSGMGPAYQLALRTLLSEVQLEEIDIDEIVPGEVDPSDDDDE
jgi:hypothetical protein